MGEPTNQDPQIRLYDSSQTLLAQHDDIAGATNRNFQLKVNLTAGQRYYLEVGNFNDFTGSYSFGIGIAANIPTDTYNIKNCKTGLYADIHGPNEQIYVHQWSFHTDNQEEWKINKETDGYYTIRSEYDLKRYIGADNNTIYTNNIKLYDGVSNKTKWKIYRVKNDMLFFEPQNAIGRVMAAPNETIGYELQLNWISDLVLDRNKWKFEILSETPLEGQQMNQWCWAASSRMLVNNYFGIPNTRMQPDAVNAVKGSVVNAPATVYETRNAGRFYRSGSTQGNDLNITAHFGDIYSENTLRKFINDGHTVCILRGWYDYNNQRDGGHFVTIIGYTTIFENGDLRYRYVIYDPYPSPEPNNWTSPVVTSGIERVASYDWICNGNNGVCNFGNDNGIWEGIVTVNTSYSSDFIDRVWN